MSKSEKKPFSDPRWNDLGRPKVIGHREISEEEQKDKKAEFRNHLRKIGALK